jgi:limonene-1,2-epoxide hydrolase
MSQETSQDTRPPLSPKEVFERMIQDVNRHDLEALVAWFAPSYRSEQPFHPERNFTGPDGVRHNWTFFFATIPDIQIDILNEAEEGDTIWAELHYHGTQVDRKQFAIRGVLLQGVQDEKIVWARLYIEPVEALG